MWARQLWPFQLKESWCDRRRKKHMESFPNVPLLGGPAVFGLSPEALSLFRAALSLSPLARLLSE